MSVLLKVTQLGKGQGWNLGSIYLIQNLACDGYCSPLASWPGVTPFYKGGNRLFGVKSFAQDHTAGKGLGLKPWLPLDQPVSGCSRRERQCPIGLGFGELPC